MLACNPDEQQCVDLRGRQPVSNRWATWRVAIGLALTIILAACSSAPKVDVPPQPKPVVKSIAMLPAHTLSKYSVSNRNPGRFLFGGIAGAIIESRYRAEEELLTEKLAETKFDPGKELAEMVAARLRDYGYAVNVLEQAPRKTGYLNRVDYEKIGFSADALLNVYFSEIGLLSPAMSKEYQTRMNAVGTVYVKGRKDYLYEEDVYHGADVKEGQNWGIPVNKRFIYPSFDAAINNLETVRLGFSTGVMEIAKRMAEQIHAAIR